MSTLRDARLGWGKARGRDYYLDAGREYIRRYGADELTAAAFAPASAKRNGRPDLVDRYYAGREDGTTWPSLNALKRNFDGSFNEYRRALGLPPNSTAGKHRRKPGEAEPILSVREHRIFTENTAGKAWLERQLEKAERRAERLAEQLDAERAAADYREGPKIVELRKRLADESHRRKDLQRELHNSVRSAARARASSERADRRGSASALREVDRLTQRLVDAQDQIRELRSTSTTVPKTKPKTVTRTRTVKVQDEKLLRTIEKQEAQAADLRRALSASEAGRDEALERLATIRRDAVAEALESQKVRSSERRVAELEGQVAQLTEILLGARRMPTEAEMQQLRTDGPAGHSIFKTMVLRVARAEGSMARKAALWDVIGAARNWIDRL